MSALYSAFRGDPSTVRYTHSSESIDFFVNTQETARFTFLIRNGSLPNGGRLENVIYVERKPCFNSPSVWHVDGKEISSHDWSATAELACELGNSYLSACPIVRVVHVVRVLQEDGWVEKWVDDTLDRPIWWNVTLTNNRSNFSDLLEEYLNIPVREPNPDTLRCALLDLVDHNGKLDMSLNTYMVGLTAHIPLDSFSDDRVTVLDLSCNYLYWRQLQLIQNLVYHFPKLTHINLSNNGFTWRVDALNSFKCPVSCKIILTLTPFAKSAMDRMATLAQNVIVSCD